MNPRNGSRKGAKAQRENQMSYSFAALRLCVRFFLFLWISSIGYGGDFDEANSLYDAGKFGEAKQVYEKLAGRGEWSANLFYDLGNAA